MRDRKTRCAAPFATQLSLGEALVNLLEGQDDIELIRPNPPAKQRMYLATRSLAFGTLVPYND